MSISLRMYRWKSTRGFPLGGDGLQQLLVVVLVEVVLDRGQIPVLLEAREDFFRNGDVLLLVDDVQDLLGTVHRHQGQEVLLAEVARRNEVLLDLLEAGVGELAAQDGLDVVVVPPGAGRPPGWSSGHPRKIG